MYRAPVASCFSKLVYPGGKGVLLLIPPQFILSIEVAKLIVTQLKLLCGFTLIPIHLIECPPQQPQFECAHLALEAVPIVA